MLGLSRCYLNSLNVYLESLPLGTVGTVWPLKFLFSHHPPPSPLRCCFPLGFIESDPVHAQFKVWPRIWPLCRFLGLLLCGSFPPVPRPASLGYPSILELWPPFPPVNKTAVLCSGCPFRLSISSFAHCQRKPWWMWTSSSKYFPFLKDCSWVLPCPIPTNSCFIHSVQFYICLWQKVEW